MRERLFAFLLTFCMILPVWSGFSVLALDSATSEDVSLPVTEEPISVDNTFNKIHFYFGNEENAFIDDMAELQSATASVQSDYAATAAMSARSGEPFDENVYITVQFASDYLSDKTYLSLKSARDEAKTAEARDMAKTRQNAYSKSYHAAIVEDNLPLLADILYTNANAIDYSSFVTLTVPAALLDTAVLAEIAENDEILHISLTDGFEVVSQSTTDTTLTNSQKTGWYDVLECIGAKDIFLNKTYTGEGIKVGIYEVDKITVKIQSSIDEIDNVCDTEHPNLQPFYNDNRLTIREDNDDVIDYGYTGTTHATEVASVLVKMLPDAQLYFANVPDKAEGEIIEGVAWFIEQGCDIVNCSFGYGRSGGEYQYDTDAVYDYQIIANNIIVVAATGNSAGTNVGSPAQAYNVIAVGGVKYDAVSNNWTSEANVSYINQSGMVKPNISAPYKMHVENCTTIIPLEGTSYAAPL